MPRLIIWNDIFLNGQLDWLLTCIFHWLWQILIVFQPQLAKYPERRLARDPVARIIQRNFFVLTEEFQILIIFKVQHDFLFGRQVLSEDSFVV